MGGTKPLEESLLPRPRLTTTTTTSTTSTTTTTTTATTTTQKVYVEYHFRSKSLLNQHFSKHGAEFADDFGYTTGRGIRTRREQRHQQRRGMAQNRKGGGGVGVFYIESTSEFVFLSTDGHIPGHISVPSRLRNTMTSNNLQANKKAPRREPILVQTEITQRLYSSRCS